MNPHPHRNGCQDLLHNLHHQPPMDFFCNNKVMNSSLPPHLQWWQLMVSAATPAKRAHDQERSARDRSTTVACAQSQLLQAAASFRRPVLLAAVQCKAQQHPGDPAALAQMSRRSLLGATFAVVSLLGSQQPSLADAQLPRGTKWPVLARTPLHASK